MPQLKVRVIDRSGALGGRDGILRTKLAAFEKQVMAARVQAAGTATQVSRASVKRTRDTAPPRHGRYTGLKDAIEWAPMGKEGAGVGLRISVLNQKFPPWLVHEIGTGQRAIQRVAGRPNPAGRPAKGATYVKTVKSQVGRKISSNFVFATKGGQYAPPGSATGQQLYLRSQVRGAPVRYDPQTRRRAPRIVISKEIKGQHFIQKGGEAGFREYRESVLAAARTQLKNRRVG